MNVEVVMQSLSVMLQGMCGIFIVMGVISLFIALLSRVFKQ